MKLSKAQQQFWDEYSRCQNGILEQLETIENISREIAHSLKNDGVLHVFGSGHSHTIAEELFHRAGGLIPVNAILEDYLMPHKGPSRVGPLERTSGLASVIANAHDMREGEVFITASNSGINAVAVELVEIAKSKGLKTVAFTSLTHSKNVPSRNSGKKLYEVADYVIDTGTPRGDACVELPGLDVKVSPLSTCVTVFTAQLLVARVCEIFTDQNLIPPVYQSANTPGGDERNKELEKKFKPRIQHLI